VGVNTTLYYSKDEGRIGYFDSISSITIVPLLHINLIKFIAISKPDEYIAYKVIKDKYITLTKKGLL
jgi:hypothetical protein